MRMTALGLVLVLSGCAASLAQLRTRAALDLACEEARLELDAVDQGTQQVRGCGKRAIYVFAYNHGMYSAWMLNSDIRPAGAGTGAAAP